jgi:hypothetical protein
MKKTMRILPKGQRPVYGRRAGILGHKDDCGCRTCRRLRTKGTERRQESRGTHDGN